MRSIVKRRGAWLALPLALGCTGSIQNQPAPDAAVSADQGGGSDGGGTDGSAAAGDGSGGAVVDGAVGDGCAGRLLCDDFEKDTVGAAPKAPWQIATNNGTVVVDGTHVHSGTRAVKVTANAGVYKQALFFVKGAPVFPVAGNSFYGRMQIWVDGVPGSAVHWTAVAGSGPLPGYAGVTSYYRYGGMGNLMANYETNGKKTDCWQHSALPMPTARWVCMEWHFKGPTNEMELSLDGAPVADQHVTQMGMGCIGNDLMGQWLAPTFDTISLGWESYQQDVVRNAWIDDVVVDTQPIGCN